MPYPPRFIVNQSKQIDVNQSKQIDQLSMDRCPSASYFVGLISIPSCITPGGDAQIQSKLVWLICRRQLAGSNLYVQS